MLLTVVFFPIQLLRIIAYAALISRTRSRLTSRDKMVFEAVGLTTITCLAFFYLMGYYGARLELEVVVPLFLIASILAFHLTQTSHSRPLVSITTSLVWILVAARLAYEVIKPGPWD
jgi:hypothetical protein